VVPGDSNIVVRDALTWLETRWAPTFAFIDPNGLQVAWSTLETLAQWRVGKTKVEMWILFPEPALARVLGLKGVQGSRSAELLDRLYGTSDWQVIHRQRQLEEIGPNEMRLEFINLLRWRLESVLGYKWTHALQIATDKGRPVYTMVFATDSPVGDRIMSHVYNNAAARALPEMRARARHVRERLKEDEQGIQRLIDEAPTLGTMSDDGGYDHVRPWRPPTSTALPDLDYGPDIDPDDFDPDAWPDQVE